MQLIRNIAIIAHVDHGKTTLVDRIIQECNVLDQRKDLGDEELKKIKEESATFPELNLLNTAIALEGIEVIDGKKAYKIKISDEKTSFYDVETGLKVQDAVSVEVQGQQMTTSFNYSDYREVSGIKFPFLLIQSMGPQKLDFIVKEIKVNEGVTDMDFE